MLHFTLQISSEFTLQEFDQSDFALVIFLKFTSRRRDVKSATYDFGNQSDMVHMAMWLQEISIVWKIVISEKLWNMVANIEQSFHGIVLR